MNNNKVNNNYFIQILNEEILKDETDELSFCLKPSPLGGVGVFCTHGVKKGTRLRLFPNGSRFISHAQTIFNEKLLNFCKFYGVEEEKGFCIPKSFTSIDAGWYMNHSDNNNSVHDEKYRYFAGRDLQGGEEITINYNQ